MGGSGYVGEYPLGIAHQPILVANGNPDTSVASFLNQKNTRLADMQGRDGAVGAETHNVFPERNHMLPSRACK